MKRDVKMTVTFEMNTGVLILLFLLGEGDKKEGSVLSNRNGTKFVRIVLQVNNLHRGLSTDGVGFVIWRHTFKMVALTSFQAEKCCRLVSARTASARRPLHPPAHGYRPLLAASAGCDCRLVILSTVPVFLIHSASAFIFVTVCHHLSCVAQSSLHPLIR